MIVTVRPGQRIATIPGSGVTVTQGRATLHAGGGVAVHVEDSFTAANGTNLNGWTPDIANTPGNTWQAAVLNWSIISNRARGTNYLYSVLVIDCGNADGIITMPCARGGNRNGIVFRYVDTSNYWRAEHSSGSGLFAIVQTAGGSDVTRASVADTSTTVLTMTVTLSGNNIQANFNSNTLNYSSAIGASATKHGIMRQDFIDNGIAEWWKMVTA